ncbi:MAG: transglycosylase SLT domain-containing protein [Gemmatimonadales bacterium]
MARRNDNPVLAALKHGALLVLGGLAVGLGMSVSARLEADRTAPPVGLEANREIARLSGKVVELEGRITVGDLKLERLTRVLQYSAAYQIPADLSATIYDAALAEGLHPSLGFQLVKVESRFQSQARSNRNALGLAQVRLGTARELDPDITPRALLEPATNLRIGFRVLRRLMRQFDNDLELALRAYNLGPTGALAAEPDSAGVMPGTAYAARVMRGMNRRLAPLPEAGPSGTP